MEGRTSASYRLELASARKREVPEELDPSGELAYIQDQFSLNVSELAKVLRVSRPAVYAWLRDETEPQPEHLRRIHQIYSLAKEWRAISDAPLGRMRHSILGGTSIISLLELELIDRSAVRNSFDAIGTTMLRTSETRRGRKTVTDELMEQFGFAEDSPEDRERLVSEATGL
jgi:transcriptional regulator with XRE-family HTH domain